MRLFYLMVSCLLVWSSCQNKRPSGLDITSVYLNIKDHGHIEHEAIALFADKSVVAAVSIWDEDMQNQGTLEYEEQIKFFRIPFEATQQDLTPMGKGRCIGFAGNDRAMVCALVRKIPDETEERWRTVFYVTKDLGKHWDSIGLLPFRIKDIYNGFSENRMVLVTESDAVGRAEILYSQDFGATCLPICSDYNPSNLQETSEALIMRCDSGASSHTGVPYIMVFEKKTQIKRYLKFNTGFIPDASCRLEDGSFITTGEILGKFYLAATPSVSAQAHYTTFEHIRSTPIHHIFAEHQEIWMFGYGWALHRQDEKAPWEQSNLFLGKNNKSMFIQNSKLMAGIGTETSGHLVQILSPAKPKD